MNSYAIDRHFDDSLWTAAQVAGYLQLSLSWVRHRTADGAVPCIRLPGGAVRYSPAEIRRWASEGAKLKRKGGR